MRSFFSSFLMSFFLTSAVIFIVHNVRQYNQSFDNCEKLLQEAQENLATYKRELGELKTQIYGSR